MLRANPVSMIGRRSSRQEVLWSANENFEKVIHRGSASARDGFWRARLRPIVCLACARQGRPQLTKALRAGGSVCGSTVDQHKPDRDLALKDCAPGMLGRKIQD